MQNYEVVFSGQVAPGADPAAVRQGVQRLFNASEELLEQFFSGRRIVVKRGLDLATAQKYRQAFNSVGAVVEIDGGPFAQQEAPASEPQAAPAATQPVEQPAPAPSAAATTPAPAPATATATATDIPPRDEYMAAFSHVQAPDFGLASPGADLLDEKLQEQVTEVDISSLSLAPAGSDLEQLPGASPIAEPDTSHLKLEEG